MLDYIGFRYIGETNHKNEKQGKGILFYADGSFYFGDLNNNKKHRIGVFVHKN